MKADVLRGHLDALLLAVLDDEPRHGYAIIETLASRTGGALLLPTGTVYPALRRLERGGFVASGWSVVSGRERRTYQLTEAGLRLLADERTAWNAFASMIDEVLVTAPRRRVDPGRPPGQADARSTRWVSSSTEPESLPAILASSNRAISRPIASTD